MEEHHYLPYMRGKQHELIALREFASQFPENKRIIPIIEPVKSTFDGLTMTVQELFKNRLGLALILNPHDGEFRRVKKDIMQEMPILSYNDGKWIPAFIYRDNPAEILSMADKWNLGSMMIIFKDEPDWDDHMEGFLANARIEYLVNGGPNARFFVRRLGESGKRMIRLDDCFNEQLRNTDYLNLDDEKFTEEHVFYRDEGFWGFSDYTVLPDLFIDGGMLPYAVAMHLTYVKNDHQINVHHFVSDTNDDQSNVQGKFREATKKVKDFFSTRDKTQAIEKLVGLLDHGEYPGLGVLKKLSVGNHLELTDRVLSEK